MEKIDDVVGVINRLKQHFGVKTDKDLRQVWGITKARMDHWKRTRVGHIPEKVIRQIAQREGLRYEWVAHGQGLPHDHVPEPSPEFARLAEIIDRVAEERTPYGDDPHLPRIVSLYRAIDPDDRERAAAEIMEVLRSYI